MKSALPVLPKWTTGFWAVVVVGPAVVLGRAGSEGQHAGSHVAVVGRKPHPVLLAVAHFGCGLGRTNEQQARSSLPPKLFEELVLLRPPHQSYCVLRARRRAGSSIARRPSAVHAAYRPVVSGRSRCSRAVSSTCVSMYVPTNSG